jgi:hypothetical protein
LKALLLAALLGGCADLPDRLDGIADAARQFAVVHPAMTGTALVAARTALHRPQHLGLMCNPRCRLTGFPSPSPSAHPRH